jgi:predicted GIY-YIG superfamily endonuclease
MGGAPWFRSALPAHMRGVGRRFVYIVRSQADPERHYVGVAGDVDARLEWHNAGPTGFTTAHRPWFVVVTIEFATEREAMQGVSVDTALLFEAFTGWDAQIWLSLQAKWDLWHALRARGQRPR